MPERTGTFSTEDYFSQDNIVTMSAKGFKKKMLSSILGTDIAKQPYT